MKRWVYAAGAALCLLPLGPGTARPDGGLRFDHRLHYEDLGLACARCHLRDDSPGVVIRPAEAFCLGCHDGKVASDECALCHVRPDAPTGYRRERSTLIFSHAGHLELEGVTCLTCHAGIPLSESASPGKPEMASCFACHDGVRRSTDCASCHTDPDRMVATIHPEGWSEEHRVLGNLDEPACEPCHRTDDKCSLCHYGDNYRGRIHPFNWLPVHAAEASARREDCTTCHDTREFCVECHTSRRVLPRDHLSPDWITRHAQEARFDVETCDACHGSDDPSCYRSGCHGF